MYYLYRHIRLDKNEVFYIGIGKLAKNAKLTSIESEYYRRAYSKTSRNRYWKNIIKSSDYEVEVLLDSDSRNFIKQKEREFIKLYGRRDLKLGTLVNMTDGGEGKEGVINSKITISKMSESAKKNITKERKIQLLRQLEKNHSTRGKFGKNHYNSIKVYQYSLNNSLIKEWDSLMDIKRELGYNISHISQCINNKRSTSKGFIWRKERV